MAIFNSFLYVDKLTHPKSTIHPWLLIQSILFEARACRGGARSNSSAAAARTNFSEVRGK